MGAALSQPYIPMLPKSINSKSKRPRYLFRLPIRWKKKRTFSEIHAPIPNPGRHDHREEPRESKSKLYDSSSTGSKESSPSHQSLPISFTTEKPLPKLPLPVIAPAAHLPNQQAQPNSSSDRPAKVMQSIDASVEAPKQEEDDSGIEHDTSDPDSDSDFSPEIERPHTPPPWDTSLSGYGSVLEVSRPFRARRVFGHPLVEGHFWGNQGDSFFDGGGGGGGPIAAGEKRRMWRVWESTSEKEKEKEKEKGEYNGVTDEWKKNMGLKSRRQKAIEGERERGKKKTKTKRRMSEWRKWKPLPRYPACTGVVVVAQRATSSTWADTAAAAAGDSDSAWKEVFVEEAEDRENQGGDKEEEEDDQGEDEHGDNDDDDLEKAIKRFLEMKIPVDLSSLRRLSTSFAGTAGEHATIVDDGTGENAGGEEGLEKVMEGGQGQLSPVESLMFTDTDIEGFEFLVEEEDEGGGTWDSGTVVGVTSGRVEGKGEACKMDGLIGDFAGNDASRQEVSEGDVEHHLTARSTFSVTQRLSRWKERR